ncbi:hypothetical protein ACP70R_029942 [Stipagrostis hirtigluma subsp. patula]
MANSPALPPSSPWVERWLPEVARPYARLARLDRSIAAAGNREELPNLKMLALFGYGSTILKCVGCTVNDLLDRDIDRKVARTKNRPLASGVLTPCQGFYFLVFQVLLCRILGTSLLFLVFSYPLMKRITYWPQAYLGLAMNWGAILGWAAIKASLDPAVILPLYTAGICWTLVYDTIYAYQDREDDLKVGVKSTASRFGDKTKYWISGFGAACIGSLALSGYSTDLGCC